MKISEVKSLSQFIYKNVKIVTSDGTVESGYAMSFTDFVESDTGREKLGLQRKNYILVFDEADIKDISIIE